MESLPPLPELPENKNIPSYFFDGFELQMNNSVIRLVLKLGHERTMTLRFAYVTGKTLAEVEGSRASFN